MPAATTPSHAGPGAPGVAPRAADGGAREQDVRTTQCGRVLLGYATLHGQRSVIADAVARRLRAHGHVVEVGDPGEGPMPPPQDYDTVVLGLPVGAGAPRRAIARYIIEHRAALAELPAALFTVSTRGANDAGASLSDFLRWVDWQPDLAAAFAADHPFAHVSLRTRIARALGAPGLLLRSPAMTDWAAVMRFADVIAAELAATPVLAPRFAAPGEPRDPG